MADPLVKQDTLRAFVITSTTRLPTMAAAGTGSYDYASFLGYYAPRGTPKATIDTLNDAFVKAISSKEGQEFFNRLGMIGKASTPQELSAFNKAQIANWERLVKVSGLLPQ